MNQEDELRKRAYVFYRTIKIARKVNRPLTRKAYEDMAKLLRFIIHEDEEFAHSVCDELGIDSDLTIEQKITHIYLFGN